MTPREAQLTEFLGSLAPGRDFEPGHGALELDSLALLQVVAYLEQNYGIRLADHDVEPDDLRSVAGILALIEQCA